VSAEVVEDNRMKVVEGRRGVHVDVNQFTWVEVKKRLWRHGLSFQEFLSYVVHLLATGDDRVYQLLIEAKKARAQKEVMKIVHTDEESLYTLMEHLRDMKRQEQEAKEEEEEEVRNEEG
jgi:signal transduction histidine kinase